MEVEYTVPSDVKTSDIRQFAIMVDELTVDVRLLDGSHGKVSKTAFLDFWNNTMTASQRVVVRQFVSQLSGLAKYRVNAEVDDLSGTVTGDLDD